MNTAGTSESIGEARTGALFDGIDQLTEQCPPDPSRPIATASRSTSQFNFSRQWRKKIAPLLNDPFVVQILTLGMRLYSTAYQEGDPPHLCGRGELNGQRPRRGCLSWYQPWGRCHHIASFCWAIGKTLYPELSWGFVSGDFHTVVIGYEGEWQQPLKVMDILFFKERTAQQSLDFAQCKGAAFFPTLGKYAASFFAEPELAYEQLFVHYDK